MAAVCDASLHLCKVRITRLDQLGNPLAGPNNSYVSDNPIMLSVKPVIEAGQDSVLTSGCECIVASRKGFDKLRRFDLEFDMGLLELEMLEMLTGSTAIIDSGSAIGLWFPDQLSCSDVPQPNVAFEGWSDAWTQDRQADDLPYFHWLFTSSRWQLSDASLQNDFFQPKVTGYTRTNTLWGMGIYGDQPEEAGPLGGFWRTATTPDAHCGWQTHAIT